MPVERGSFGDMFGTVGGLIAGPGQRRGQALLDGGARRMRALTGFDRVTSGLRRQARREQPRRVRRTARHVRATCRRSSRTREPKRVACFPRDADDDSIGACA